MDFFRQFLGLRYYFSPVPTPHFRFAVIFLILGGLLILSGIMLRIYRRKGIKDEILKKMLRHYPRFFEVFGGIMILLVLIRISGVPYLSMRLWWAIFGLLFIYFVVSRLIKFKAEYHSRLERLKQNERIGRFFKK
ncbi:hypothetical protein HZA43_03380 [Candidatus Peregrinibacteria bacterium]|nr:hypothetical protein [Candidatus Peregrinibacteria bacterium]